MRGTPGSPRCSRARLRAAAHRGLPPLVAIDHVPADGRAGAIAVEVHDPPGSDHRALFADLRLRP
ncbi:hypothetical protein [Nonomuraea sp. B1E8]|uniref:hypothetical protein n=1 Tax=unclassified Nonomuraea TaxID=2593643 RepID=UPI00325C8304